MRILLSIKPEYASKILDGSKKFEYRRKIYKRTGIKKVIIYATLPVGKVVGEFQIEGVIESCPKQLWAETKEASGITYDFYSSYFSDREKAFALKVGKVRRYKIPKCLTEFLDSGIAPQSYAYV